MQVFVFICSILGALLVGFALGCFLVLVPALIKRRAKKPKYNYKDRHTWRDVKEMSKVNQLNKSNKQTIDGTSSSENFHSGN